MLQASVVEGESMAHKVVYLTGAPSSGKTSLATALAAHLSEIKVFNYGKAMLRHLQDREQLAPQIDLELLRRDTYRQVSVGDVRAINRELATWIEKNRDSGHLIIDTHQVAFGPDGLCALGFTKAELANLSIHEVWVLAAPPRILRERIISDPQGRLIPSEFMADCHSGLQSSLALSYARELNCYFRVFDASVALDDLLATAVRALESGLSNV
jgi:adenylate kinase